jgi:UDP:flavonoid glycosyltransferase YjiC (YdhE family)
MRVLFTTIGAVGHFHPLVPLAQTLVRAGHEVAFATTPNFCPTIEALGFETFECGVNTRGVAARMVLPGAPEPTGDAYAAFTESKVFARLNAQSTAYDLLFVHHLWCANVIVREAFEFGGCIAAEVAGIPHAVVEVGAYRPSWWRRAGIAQSLNAVRADFDLPSDPEMAMLARYLHLSFVPPSFHDPAEPMPATTHTLRHVSFDQVGDETLPGWISSLPDQPTVYVTLGSFYGQDTSMMAALIAALRNEPLNIIVTVGRTQDPAIYGPQPSNVRIERYIPNTLLLPQCDVVVSHAGWNTTLGALTLGVPVVCVPRSADQPANARRCAELGVGVVIESSAPSAESLRESVRAVLSSPNYREKAKRVQAENDALPGPEHAVALLERLSHDKEPLLSA